MILEYKLKLLLEEIPTFVKEFFERLGSAKINQEQLFDIKLSLEEALINAIKYGNKSDPNKEVELKLESSTDKIIIDIKDQGQGFDHRKLALPTEGENIEKTSGRGVFLIKNFMDEVEYLDNGSRVRMVKYIKAISD